MRQGNLSDLSHRVFNKPGMILPAKYQTILGVLQPRLGIASLTLPGQDAMNAADLRHLATTALATTPRAEGRGRQKTFAQFGGIAVIPIEGTLVHKLGSVGPYSGMTGYDGLRIQLHEALVDPEIGGILFDANSPGGEVAGCFDLVDEIFAAREIKPIWAVANEDSYSACYALISAADRIFVPRTGGVGSIGVICGHVDWSKHLEDEGIKVTMIYAGERKNDGSPYAPLSDEAYKWIKAEIDRTYEIFSSTVARNRGLKDAAVRATEAGCFFGEGAVAAGLADEVAAPEEVMARMSAELTAGTLRSGGPAARRSATPTEKDTNMTTTNAGGGFKARVGAAIALLSNLASAEDDENKDKKDGASEQPPADDKDKKEGASDQPPADDKDKEKGKKEGAADDEEDDAEDDGKDDEGEGKETAASAKTRIAAIMNSPHAKGREATAQALALETDLSVKEAEAVLKTTPKSAGGPGLLDAAMQRHGAPPINAGGGGEDTADSVASRMASYVNAPRAKR